MQASTEREISVDSDEYNRDDHFDIQYGVGGGRRAVSEYCAIVYKNHNEQ